jgi:hypothetical protein
MDLAEAKTLRGELFDRRPDRVIIPLGDFGDEVEGSAWGAISEFVRELVGRVREELNAAGPELCVWWSAPVLPYGMVRVGKHDQAMLGMLPDHWWAAVASLVEAGLTWTDRVILVCATEEQAQVLRENIPLLRESGRSVVFGYEPYAPITHYTVERVVEALWENEPDDNGELDFRPAN